MNFKSASFLIAVLSFSAIAHANCDFSKKQDPPRSSASMEGAIERHLVNVSGRSNVHVDTIMVADSGDPLSISVRATICNGNEKDQTSEKFVVRRAVFGNSPMVYIADQAPAQSAEKSSAPIAK